MHWVDPRRHFPDSCRPNLYGMRCQPIAADFFRRARYRRHNRSALTMRQWTRRKQKPSLFAWIPLFSTRFSASSPIRMSLASSGTSANGRPDIVPQGFNHSAEAFQSKPLQSALFRRTVTDLYPTGNLPVLPYRSDFSLEGRRSIRASGVPLVARLMRRCWRGGEGRDRPPGLCRRMPASGLVDSTATPGAACQVRWWVRRPVWALRRQAYTASWSSNSIGGMRRDWITPVPMRPFDQAVGPFSDLCRVPDPSVSDCISDAETV